MSEIPQIRERLQPLDLKPELRKVALLISRQDVNEHDNASAQLFKQLQDLHKARAGEHSSRLTAQQLREAQKELDTQINQADRRDKVRELFQNPHSKTLNLNGLNLEQGALASILKRIKQYNLTPNFPETDTVDTQELHRKIQELDLELKRLADQEKQDAEANSKINEEIQSRANYVARVERIKTIFTKDLSATAGNIRKIQNEIKDFDTRMTATKENAIAGLKEEKNKLAGHEQKAEKFIDYYHKVTTSNPALLVVNKGDRPKDKDFKQHLGGSYEIALKILEKAKARLKVIEAEIEDPSKYQPSEETIQKKAALELRLSLAKKAEEDLITKIKQYYDESQAITTDDYKVFEETIMQLIIIIQENSDADLVTLAREDIAELKKQNPKNYDLFVKFNPEQASVLKGEESDTATEGATS